MADLRSIDIFVRAHDEASKVFAKIAAAEKTFMNEQGKSIRARVQQVNDGVKAENAAHKAGLVTRAREQAKADEQIRKSQSDTVEHAKRKQSDLVNFVAKSNRRIMEIHADTARQISIMEARQRIRDEDRVAKETRNAERVAAARIKAEQDIANFRNRLDKAQDAARAKGGFGGGVAKFLFPGANDVQSDIDRTRKRLNGMERDLQAVGKVGALSLGRLGQHIKGIEGGVASLSSKSRTLVQNMGGLRGMFERVGASAASSGGPIKRFGSLLQFAIVLMGPILGGLAQLAGGLFSVGAAAGVAAIGIGGVFAAALAQTIPLIGLAIVAFTSLAKVLKISQQQQQNQLADIGRQGAATGKAADNTDRLANAQESLIDAQRRLGDARKEAIRQLQDLADKERAAQLAAKGAALSVVDAQLALSRALAGGDALAVRHAQLDLENAKVDNSQTQRDASRTTADARVTRRQGVEGNEGVIAARRALADAERSVDSAQKQSAASAGGLAAADARLNEEIKRLTPEQKRLLLAVNEFRDILKGPEFTQITDIVTEPITRFVRGLSKALRDPQIIAALTDTAKVYAGIFDRLGDKVTGPGGRSFFADMAKESRINGPIIEKSVTSIGSIFAKVARAASPLLTGLLKSLATNLGSADRALTQSKLNTFFAPGGKADKAIRTFLNLFKSFGQLLANLGGASADSGVGLIDRLTKAMDRFNERFNKDPAFRDKIVKFFQDAAKGTGDFVAALGKLGEAILKNTDSGSLEKLSKFMTEVLAPTLENLLFISNLLSGALRKLLDVPFGPQVLQIVSTFLILNKAFGVLSALFNGLGNAIKILRVAFVALRWVMLALIEGNPIVLAITAIILILIILEQRFGLLTKLLDFVKAHWKEVWEAISGFVKEMVLGFIENVAIIGGKINDIYNYLDKLVQRISKFVSGAWKSVWDSMTAVVEGIGDTIGNIFDGVVNKVVAGMNKIIDGVNWFIGLINKINPGGDIGKLGHIGVGSDKGSNNAGTSAASRMATGGWVPARSGGNPIIAGEAGYDELVLSTDPKYRIRNQELLREYEAKTVQRPGGGSSKSGQFEGDPGPKKVKSGGGGAATPVGRGAGGAVMHLVQMLNMAQKMDAMNLPYSWGGGHTQPAHPSYGIERGAGTFGWDCSGSVSQVLQAAYPGMPTMTSGMFQGYGSLFKPGPGAVTVWGNTGHVFMDIAGRRYGTGGGQPGGGFGLNGHGTGGFNPVHPKDLGKNPAGSGFMGKALNKAIGLGGGALSAFADAVGKLTDFATGFSKGFLDKFGAKPGDPITGGIYDFVKNTVAHSLERMVSVDIPGFKEGGDLPGRPGQPGLFVGHGGESVLNTQDKKSLINTGSKVVDALLKGIFGNVNLNGVGLGNLSGVSKKKGLTTDALVKDIDNIANKFGLFFAKLGDQIDAISTRIGNMARAFAHTLNSKTFTTNADGSVSRNRSEDFAIQATELNQGELIAERAQIQDQIGRNNAGITAGTSRIAALRARETALVKAINKKGQRPANVKKWRAELAAVRAAIQSAQAGVSGLQARSGDLQDSLDQNIAATADAQDQELSARLGVTADEDTQIGSSQLRGQLASLRGDTGGQRNELVLQGTLISKKIAELTEQQKNYGVGSPEWQQFQDAIVQNQISLEENTKAIEELSGGLGLQDFSSAPWRLFRSAVFNGLGGLMPQYSIPGINVPGAAIGANLLSDGLVFGHRGEKIVPAHVARSNDWGGGTNIEINVDQAGQDLDVEYLARRMAWEARGL